MQARFCNHILTGTQAIVIFGCLVAVLGIIVRVQFSGMFTTA